MNDSLSYVPLPIFDIKFLIISEILKLNPSLDNALINDSFNAPDNDPPATY